MRLKLIGIGVGILVLALLLWRFEATGSGTPGKAVLPTNQNVNVAKSPVDPASICTIQITSPTAATDIPGYGPVKVSWSGGGGPSDLSGSKYDVYINGPNTPNGFGGGTLYDNDGEVSTDNNSLNIYMEQYPTGVFSVEVDAWSPDGKTKCSAVVDFNKSTSWTPNDQRKQKGSDSGGAAPLTGIVVNPQGP